MFGIAFGVATQQILKIVKRGGHNAPEQLALSVAMAYLSFYAAQMGKLVSNSRAASWR